MGENPVFNIIIFVLLKQLITPKNRLIIYYSLQINVKKVIIIRNFFEVAILTASQNTGIIPSKLIPCSTKKFRRFFGIKSVFRNVETKGKVFWK